MFPTISTTDILFATSAFLFTLWPIILAVALQRREAKLPAMMMLWTILAFVRGFIAFDPQPLMPTFLISEPLNTMSFVVVGVILFGLCIGSYQQR